MSSYDRQYRPIYTSETATDDAVSVRAVRDLANNVNNAFARVMCPVLVCDMFPDFHILRFSTVETVLLRWSARWVGTGWSKLIFAIYGVIGSGSADFKLYASQNRYDGPDAITAAGKATLGQYDVGTLTISGATLMPTPVALDLIPNDDGEIYLMLTYNGGTEIVPVYLISITVVASHEGII